MFEFSRSPASTYTIIHIFPIWMLSKRTVGAPVFSQDSHRATTSWNYSLNEHSNNFRDLNLDRPRDLFQLFIQARHRH